MKLTASRLFRSVLIAMILVAPAVVASSAQAEIKPWRPVLFGYIDKTGKIVVPNKYQGAQQFCEGRARVEIAEKGARRWGYIDRSGRRVGDLYADACDFSGGLAAVLPDEQAGVWGFIDTTGRMTIEPRFKSVEDFSDGLARIGPCCAYHYIDKSGRKVVDAGLRSLRFSEGLADFSKDGKHGYINKKGVVAIPPQFEDTHWWFSEGMAAVKVNGKWGYIDKKGQFAIKPQFDDAWAFSEGLAMVRQGDAWGYVDKVGRMAVPCRFVCDWGTAGCPLSHFSEGLACVQVGAKYGFIDRTGAFVVKPVFDYAESFSEGLACVSLDERKGLFGYINTSGTLVIPAMFNKAGSFKQGLAACGKTEEMKMKPMMPGLH